MILENLVEGHSTFKQNVLPNIENDLKHLAEHGQHPEVLFIGCSDSRVTPDIMLNTKPGDMFILRNVGNFIPPFKHDEDFHGTAAAIEYAVSVLKVKHIIVCGHSHCGACESLYKDIPNDYSLIHVKTWLKLGKEAKEVTLKEANFTTEDEKYRETERNSLKSQIKKLDTYPEIKRLHEKGDLQIHGWIYDIESGRIEFYNEEDDTFKPLEELKA